MNDRIKVLNNLLTLSKPLNEIVKNLNNINWDSDEELVTLTIDNIINILNLYCQNQIDNKDIELWANLIEGREDISFELNNEFVIENTIHHLSNPELEGTIDLYQCKNMISLLQREMKTI